MDEFAPVIVLQFVVPLEEKAHVHVTPVTLPSGSDNLAVTVSPAVGIVSDRVTDPSSSSVTAAVVTSSALFPGARGIVIDNRGTLVFAQVIRNNRVCP